MKTLIILFLLFNVGCAGVSFKNVCDSPGIVSECEYNNE